MLTDCCQPFFLTCEDFSEAVVSNCAVILATTASSRLHSRSLYLLSNLERLCVRDCLCWYIQKLYDQDSIWTTVFGWRTVDYFAVAQLPWLWHMLTYKRGLTIHHSDQLCVITVCHRDQLSNFTVRDGGFWSSPCSQNWILIQPMLVKLDTLFTRLIHSGLVLAKMIPLCGDFFTDVVCYI